MFSFVQRLLLVYSMHNLEGCCVTCGYLSIRAKRSGRWRPHAGYYEVEQPDRENPLASFDFVPGETNALHKGELVCYRHAADLSHEIVELATSGRISEDEAARATIYKVRACDRWSKYEPGLDPRQHFVELNARALEADRREFQVKMSELEQRQDQRDRRQDRRLNKTAILFAVIIGLAQIIASTLAMTKDSIGFGWLKYIYQLIIRIISS